VPVGRVARQPRDFQAHDDAGLVERHLADKLLKSISGDRTGSGFAQVAIDDVNPLGGPAACCGTVAQRILPLRAFTVLGHLA
jgi:hypothetical protein